MSSVTLRPSLETTRRAASLVPRTAWPFLVFVVLFFVGGAIRPGVLGLNNLFSTAAFAMVLALAAAGQTVTILQGGIDLSIPNTLTIAAIAYAANQHALGAVGALLVSLAIGLAVGLFNGLGVTLLRIPPIVMTIAANGILLGSVLLFFTVSQDSQLPALVTDVTSNQLVIAGVRIAAVVPLGLGVLLAVQLLLSFSGWGRMVAIVGATPEMARFSGLSVNAIRVSAYAASGLLSAFAGIAIAGFFQQTASGMGDPYLLGSIAAVVVGGASIFGGRASVIATLGGALVLQQIATLLAIANFGVNIKQILYGVVILVVVAVYGREALRSA